MRIRKQQFSPCYGDRRGLEPLEPEPMTEDHDLLSPAPIVLIGDAFPPTYAIVAPLVGNASGWSVHSCAAKRIVVTGLSQARAMMLNDLLNRTSHQHATPPVDVGHRRMP